jgi:hypothetical protein
MSCCHPEEHLSSRATRIGNRQRRRRRILRGRADGGPSG